MIRVIGLALNLKLESPPNFKETKTFLQQMGLDSSYHAVGR